MLQWLKGHVCSADFASCLKELSVRIRAVARPSTVEGAKTEQKKIILNL